MSKVGRRLYMIGSQLHDTWKLVSSLVDAHNAHVTETHERLPHRGQVDSQGMTLLRISDRLERIEEGMLRLDQKVGLIDQSLEEMNLRQEHAQGTEGGSGLSLGDEVEPGSLMWDRLTPDERDVIANRIVLGLRAMAEDDDRVRDGSLGAAQGPTPKAPLSAADTSAPVQEAEGLTVTSVVGTAKRTYPCQGEAESGVESWVSEGKELYERGYRAGEEAGREQRQGVTWSGGRQGQGMGKGQAGTGTEAER